MSMCGDLLFDTDGSVSERCTRPRGHLLDHFDETVGAFWPGESI